jgi:hypothetical protein
VAEGSSTSSLNSGTSEEEDPESQRSDSDEEISGPQVDCVTTAETTDDAVEEKNDTDEMNTSIKSV